MKFDLFKNIKSATGVPCTPEALAEAVNTDSYIQAVKELQAATDEDGERRAKNKLPVVTFNASFDGKPRKNANAIPSGLFFSDYDGIENPRKLYSEKICGRCDELGILRVEVSIRQHGLHLITECRPELTTIAENQKWLDGQLGLECDKACKDLARATYAVPESFVLFERGRLWNGEKNEELRIKNEELGEAQKSEAREGGEGLQPHRDILNSEFRILNSDDSRESTISKLESIPYNPEERFGDLLYADILKRYWKSELGRETPLKGERHASLMDWARQVCYFTDFDLELMKRVTPTLGKTDHEVAEIIYDTLRWRDDHKTPVTPSKLKSIVRGMEVAQRALGHVISSEAKKSSSEDNVHRFSPEGRNDMNIADDDDPHDEEFLSRMPSLPIGLKDSLVGVPDKVKMPILCGLMPLAMTYASRVNVKYCDGKNMRLNSMCIIFGKQASGKSSVKDVLDVWMKPMMDADAEVRKHEDEFKQLKKNRKANEKLPEEPHDPIINVPVTISCSTLLKRMKNSDGMHLFSFGEELDTLRKTNGAGSWSSKYDVYRLAFDNGVWGQDYNSDNAESGVVPVAYNWTVLGTMGAVSKCFKNDNVENGMGGRVLFSKMPSKKFEYMPTYKEVKTVNADKINEAVHIMASAHGFIDTPELRKTMKKWCNDMADEARENNDEVVDTFRKRAAVIGFRCGVVFHLLESENSLKKLQKESKNCQTFAVLMAEYAMKYQCELFGDQILENVVVADGIYRSKNRIFFESLPKSFTSDELKAMRPETTTNGLRQMVFKWERKGMVVKVSKDNYEKCQSR